LILVLRLQAGNDARVRQRGGVAERSAFGDVPEQTPHDFAGTCLRQIRGEENVVGPSNRADLLGDVRLQFVGALGRSLL
jgi:hypothetical protein